MAGDCFFKNVNTIHNPPPALRRGRQRSTHQYESQWATTMPLTIQCDRSDEVTKRNDLSNQEDASATHTSTAPTIQLLARLLARRWIATRPETPVSPGAETGATQSPGTSPKPRHGDAQTSGIAESD